MVCVTQLSLTAHADVQTTAKHATEDVESLRYAVQGIGISDDGVLRGRQEKKPKRFCRVATLTANELIGTPQEELEQLLRSSHSGESTEAGGKRKEREQDKMYLQYEQIRIRKGKTLFEATESRPDPLKCMGTVVYDMVCRDQSQAHHEELPPELPSQPQPEVLQNEGTDMTTDYVYDLYVVDDAFDMWKEEHHLHPRILHIYDDGDYLVQDETSDKTDSDEDSEDSNAEGYFLNDYPDEDEWCGTDDSDDDGRRREWFDSEAETPSDNDDDYY